MVVYCIKYHLPSKSPCPFSSCPLSCQNSFFFCSPSKMRLKYLRSLLSGISFFILYSRILSQMSMSREEWMRSLYFQLMKFQYLQHLSRNLNSSRIVLFSSILRIESSQENLPRRLWYYESIDDSRFSMQFHWYRQQKRENLWMGVESLRKYLAFMMNLQLQGSVCMKQDSSQMHQYEIESPDSLSQLDRSEQSWDCSALSLNYNQRLLNQPISEQQPLLRILELKILIYYYSRKRLDKNLSTYCLKRPEQGDSPSKQHFPIVLTNALKISTRQGSVDLELDSLEKQMMASCGSDLARKCRKFEQISLPQRHLKQEDIYVLKLQLLVRISLRRTSMFLRIFSTPFEKSIDRISPSLVIVKGNAFFSFGFCYYLPKSASVRTQLMRCSCFILNCRDILMLESLVIIQPSLFSVAFLLCFISSFFENFESFFCYTILKGLISLLLCTFGLMAESMMLSADWLNGFFMIQLRIFLMSTEARKEELLLLLLVLLTSLMIEERSSLGSMTAIDTSDSNLA